MCCFPAEEGFSLTHLEDPGLHQSRAVWVWLLSLRVTQGAIQEAVR